MPKYSQYPGESKERFKVRMARQAAGKGRSKVSYDQTKQGSGIPKYKDTNGDAAALKDIASVLSGSKRKARRTSRKGRRRGLYT